MYRPIYLFIYLPNIYIAHLQDIYSQGLSTHNYDQVLYWYTQNKQNDNGQERFSRS